ALARLDEVAAAHARFSTPSLRVELIAEFVTSPHATPYGVAGLLTCQPAFAAEVAGRLKGLVAELVERLRPARMLVGEVVDKPGQFFVLGDSSYPVDLDRYLQSSLHRQHLVALESLLVAPTRWFALDRVWRYVKAGARASPTDGACSTTKRTRTRAAARRESTITSTSPSARSCSSRRPRRGRWARTGRSGSAATRR